MPKEQNLQNFSENMQMYIAPSERKMNLGQGWNDYTYILPVTEAIEQKLLLKKNFELPEGNFTRKKEFHVTIMGLGTKDLVKSIVENKAQKGENAVEAINKMLSETDFSFNLDPDSAKLIHNLDYDPEAVRTKTGRAAFESEYTIIVDVSMPEMQTLYDRVRSELGIDLGKPASHITLYIKDNGDATGLGIGIYDLKKQIRGEMEPQIETKPIELKTLI